MQNSDIQHEVLFMIVQKPFLFHFSELERQSAALDGEKVRELLAGEWDVELDRAAPLRLGGEVGHELGARRALGDVRELFVEQQVFARKVAQKVSDDAAVVRAGGGTDRQKALDVQKQHRCRRFGHDAHIGDTVWRAGEGRGIRLPRCGAGENVAVAPDILLHDERAAGEHHAGLLDRVAGVEEKHVLGELLGLCRKAGEHRVELVLRDAGKERRGGENGKKFFHKKRLSLKIQPTCWPHSTIIRLKTQGGIAMKRRIIEIDQNKCNGCGACAAACHEGAIAMVNGKAQLMRDDYCDGLGDCLPTCPTGAISFVEREAAAYDEQAVLENKQKRMQKEGMTLHHSCPGMQLKTFAHKAASETAAPAAQESQLSQWPVQIKLVPVNAPYFSGAKLLIAADCTAYAYAAFHEKFIKGHITLVGCPKLDSVDYSEKLTEIIAKNDIKSVTVVRMEVPCCGGLEHAAKTALQNSGKFIPWQVVTISTDGRILDTI